MRYIAILLLGLLALPSYALTKVNVYNAEVVLDENDTDAEAAARLAGMQQVIVRASGDKQSVGNPVVVKALRQSGQYLSQISYGNEPEQQTLKMVFNAPQIRALLTQAQLPFWTEERASVLVWLVEEGRYGREIIWDQSGDSSVIQLQSFAGVRGLPVTVPVGDIEDVTGITPPELWGGFAESIGNASMRYPADAVLVLRIHRDGADSSIRYTLYNSTPALMGTSKQIPVSGNSRGVFYQALEQVVDEISDYFASRSSVKYSGESTSAVEAQFLEIKSANDFFALEKLLRGLNSVAGVDLVKIAGSEVTLRIHLLASVGVFDNELIQNYSIRKFDIDMLDPQSEPASPQVSPEEAMAPNGDFVEAESQVTPEIQTEETQLLNKVADIAPADEEELPAGTGPLIYEWIR